MRHTISVLVDNEFGVLSKVSGLFSGRGFNIESLCVAETLDLKVSRMTIVTTGDDQVVEQITKQLNKLINVIKVSDLTCLFVLLRVHLPYEADSNHRPEIYCAVSLVK